MAHFPTENEIYSFVNIDNQSEKTNSQPHFLTYSRTTRIVSTKKGDTFASPFSTNMVRTINILAKS